MNTTTIEPEIFPSKIKSIKPKGTIKTSIPIVLFLVFAASIFLVIIPRISAMLAKLDEINKNSAGLEEINTKIKTFSSINFEETTSLLSIIREIAPSSNTDITNFQNEIRSTIENIGGITLVNLKLRDDELSQDPELVGPLQLREVPIDIELVSTKDNLQLFLDTITSGNDFVTVSQMSFKKIEQADEENWRMNLSLIKSQFVEGTTVSNFYSIISPNSTVNDLIKDKLLEISSKRI